MNWTEDAYINTIRKNRDIETIKREMAFGMTLGTVLMLVSSFQLLFISNSSSLWAGVLCIGIFFELVAVAAPGFFSIPERLGKNVVSHVFGVGLKVIILSVFFAIVMPIHLILRLFNRTRPFFSWKESKSHLPAGSYWNDVNDHVYSRVSTSSPNIVVEIIKLVVYFLGSDKWYLLPGLIALLILSIFVLFTQSSAVAPLIYTLF